MQNATKTTPAKVKTGKATKPIANPKHAIFMGRVFFILKTI